MPAFVGMTKHMRFPYRDARCVRTLLGRVGKAKRAHRNHLVGNDKSVAHPTDFPSLERGMARRKAQSMMVSRSLRDRAGASRRAMRAHVAATSAT
jgi:hypothetical protein